MAPLRPVLPDALGAALLAGLGASDLLRIGPVGVPVSATAAP